MIGFDLDMTLTDTRVGIGAALSEVARATGTFIDVELAVSRFGPPLEDELARWFPADEIDDALALAVRYLHAEGARQVLALPGAADALRAAKDLAPTLVVTRKPTDLALMSLDAAGLAADKVVGDVWGMAKAAVLIDHSASVYVGDDPADMRAAVAANAIAVGVTTGPASGPDLIEAGATVVLRDLFSFPDWLMTSGLGPSPRDVRR